VTEKSTTSREAKQGGEECSAPEPLLELGWTSPSDDGAPTARHHGLGRVRVRRESRQRRCRGRRQQLVGGAAVRRERPPRSTRQVVDRFERDAGYEEMESLDVRSIARVLLHVASPQEDRAATSC